MEYHVGSIPKLFFQIVYLYLEWINLIDGYYNTAKCKNREIAIEGGKIMVATLIDI